MILTENLTLFWFAYVLVNEYKPEFQFRKCPKKCGISTMFKLEGPPLL